MRYLLICLLLPLFTWGCQKQTAQQAVEANNPSILKKKIQANPTLAEDFELVASAIDSDNHEILGVFLDTGTDPNFYDNWNSLLHRAASADAIQCSRLLLARGARVDFPRDGRTPLHLAASQGNLGTLKLLLENGARIDHETAHRESTLHLACASGSLESVRLLVEAMIDS